MSDNFLAFLIIAIFVGTMFFISYKGYKSSKARKNAIQKNQIRLGATMSGTLKHVSGLPFAKGAVLDVYCAPDKIVFKNGGQEAFISRNKIENADLVIPGNATRKAMSGAASGKYVGGKTGAAIGALSAIIPNLVISYVSGTKRKQIVLDTSSGGSYGSKLYKEISKGISHKRSSIEL